MDLRAPLTMALFISVALAGCAGEDAPITVSQEGERTWTFTSGLRADNYTWEMGDRATVLYGKSVTHTYDISNGKVTVRLTATTDGQTRPYETELVLGTGKNQGPTDLFMELSGNWTIPGETVKLRAGGNDPDGDGLRFGWTCVRTGDAIKTPIHTHPGQGGEVYGSENVQSVARRLAEAPIAGADRVVEGDLCDVLSSSFRMSADAVIEGRFERTGIYDITLVAGDALAPTKSGTMRIIASKPEDRPEALQVRLFNGTFQGGSGGSLQGAGDQVGQVLDRAQHVFQLPLNALGGNITLDLVSDAPAAAANWEVKRGAVTILAGDGPVSFGPGTLEGGKQYVVDLVLEQGVQVDYAWRLQTALNMDPFTVF